MMGGLRTTSNPEMAGLGLVIGDAEILHHPATIPLSGGSAITQGWPQVVIY